MILNLNALRALAAWMVVAHHLRDPLGRIWPPLGETQVFAAGVDVFFVLSGAVMAISTAGREIRPREFWARRIARIGPLYWLVTLALAAALAAGLNPVGVAGWDGGDLAASLAFWPDIRADGYPGPLLGVGWTLTFEAGFYALFGLALLAGRAAPYLALFALVGLVLAGTAAPADAPHALRVWTAPPMLEFAAGVAVGLWWIRPGAGAEGGGSGADGAWRFCLAIAAATVALGAARIAEVSDGRGLIAPGAPGAAWRVFCFGVPAVFLVLGALFAERAGRIAGWRWAQGQGDASYAVYLIHLPLIQAAAIASGWLAGGAAANWGAVLLAAALTAGLAVLAHRWVERPCGAAVRAALGAGQQRPKSSSRRMMSSSSR